MNHRAIRPSLLGFLSVVLLFPQTPLSAQEIPSPAQVLGYELGERFTPVAGVNHYFSALAGASEVVSVHPYGTSMEGRPLIQVLVFYGLIRALSSAAGGVIMAKGKANWTFLWNLALFALIPLTIYLAARTGDVLMVAWALVVLQAVLWRYPPSLATRCRSIQPQARIEATR